MGDANIPSEPRPDAGCWAGLTGARRADSAPTRSAGCWDRVGSLLSFSKSFQYAVVGAARAALQL